MNPGIIHTINSPGGESSRSGRTPECCWVHFNPGYPDAWAGFKRVSSGDLPPVRLRRRNTVKYIIPCDKLPEFLDTMKVDFSLVEREGEILRRTELQYFDTPVFSFYRDHINGKLNRIKIRSRRVNLENVHVLEVWKRKNKGEMVKKCYPADSLGGLILQRPKLGKYFPDSDTPELVPALDCRFDRLTFIRKDGRERITLDVGLTFMNPGDEDRVISFSEVAILEVRRKKYVKSFLSQWLKTTGFRKSNISKYCLGISRIYPGLKSNTYKSVLRNIEKYTIHGYTE